MSSAFGKSRLPQVVSQGKVIWRHPHGRFDVIEYLGKSPLGTPYRIREAVLTPERDARGILHKEKPPEPEFTVRKSTARRHSYRRIGRKEAVMIADMYQAGYSCNRIAQALGRDHTSIGEFIRRNRITRKMPPPEWQFRERQTTLHTFIIPARRREVNENRNFN